MLFVFVVVVVVVLTVLLFVTRFKVLSIIQGRPRANSFVLRPNVATY